MEELNGTRQRELFESSGVWNALLRLACPTIAGQVILVVYNMADTFFVGLAGNDAMLTAVTVCMPAYMFLSAIANLFGIGGASAIARSMGAGEQQRAGVACSFAFWGCLAATALYALAAFLAEDLFVDILGGTNTAVHENARQYLLCTVIVGGEITSISILLAHLIRAEGRAVHASVGIALGGLLNIGLDPLFMFVILPSGKEALGAAIATTLANFVSLLYFVVVLLCIRKGSWLRFGFSRQILMRRIPRLVLEAGIPACIMTLLENISYAVLDKLMSLSGLEMQAGIGVAKKVNMLAHCIVRGIAQGSLPLIAYNYASGDRQRMHACVRASHILSITTATMCMTVSLVFAKPLIGLFIHSGSASLHYGIVFLRILCIGGPFSASAYTIISFFQATGNGKKSFLLAILRKGLVDIPLMFLLSAIVPVYGIVAATPLTDILCCLAANTLYIRFVKQGKAWQTMGEGVSIPG